MMAFVGKLIISFLFLQVVSAHKAFDDVVREAVAQRPEALQFDHGNNTVLVEYDMIMPIAQYQYLQKYGLVGQENKPVEQGDEALVQRFRRKGISDETQRWPKAELPFVVERGLLNKEEKHQLELAIAGYHKYTCIKFVPGKPNESKVRVQDGSGCSALVGFQDIDNQQVNLNRLCRHKGTIQHEFLHALGCFHEQSRPDRDNFVTIAYDNILADLDYNFAKYNEDVVPRWDVEYDYESVMHYGGTAFTANGKPTIVARDAFYQDKMGNRRGLSFYDIKLVNKMYKCDYHCPSVKRCPREGFQGPDCKCWCKGPDRNTNPVEYCIGGGEPTDPGAPVVIREA